MDPESEDVKVAGNIQKYTECPKILVKWCLADHVSWLDICTTEGRYGDHYSSDYSPLYELFPIKWKSGKYL